MRNRAEHAREYDGLRYADGALVVESSTYAPDLPDGTFTDRYIAASHQIKYKYRTHQNVDV